jgi:hypothetical protein
MTDEMTKAREIVTEWMGMFDPPPQIDFQQSEFLQHSIASALAAQPAAPVREPCPGCDGHECDDGCQYPGAVKPAAPVGDWLEDAAHENGNYQCRCVHCGRMFIGHKRRVTCKACADWRDGWNAAISTTPGDH